MAGALSTVSFSGEVKGILTTDDVAQQVSQALQWAGYTVRSISVTTPVWSNVFTGAWLHYSYVGKVVFDLSWDAGSDELTNAVTNAVLGVTGLSPTGLSVDRGATAIDAQPGGNLTPAFAFNPFDSLTSGLKDIGIGVLVLVLAIVALLIFRPDIGRLAAA